MHSILIFKTLVFFLIWLLLSESYDLLHMGMGLLVALGVAWLNTDASATRSTQLPLRTLGYVPWLVGRILQSGWHLSMLILAPDLPIDPKMIRHRCGLNSDSATVLLGNSITLTPGTITVEVEKHELLVHAMDDESADDVTTGRMERRVARVFNEGARE